jgi:hypothetical protein
MSKESAEQTSQRLAVEREKVKAYMTSADGRRPHYGKMRDPKVPSVHCTKTITGHCQFPVKTRETAETAGMAETERDIFHSTIVLCDQEITQISCEGEELKKELEDMEVQLQRLKDKEVPRADDFYGAELPKVNLKVCRGAVTLDYPDDVVVHTINRGRQATAFYMSMLCDTSSNKSKKGKSDDAGELICHDEKLSEEALLLGYHYEPLEDELAKKHPDLLEE